MGICLAPSVIKPSTDSLADLDKGEKSTKERWEESRQLIRNLKIRLKDESEDMGEKIKINLENMQDIGDLRDMQGNIMKDINHSIGRLRIFKIE